MIDYMMNSKNSKIFIPGIIATVFKALRTLKVRKEVKLPRSLTPIVTYAKTITVKSSQFHGSLRYVNGSNMKPLAVIFRQDSNV